MSVVLRFAAFTMSCLSLEQQHQPDACGITRIPYGWRQVERERAVHCDV